jgi:hypothetical protein
MSLKDIDDVEKSAGSDFTSPAATICAAGLGAVELTELQKTRGMCSPWLGKSTVGLLDTDLPEIRTETNHAAAHHDGSEGTSF